MAVVLNTQSSACLKKFKKNKKNSMIYPIEKIKKILQEISPWPWDMFKLPSHKFFTIISNDDVPIIESVITSLPITDKQYFSNTRLITESPQIISGLIEEVEQLQWRFKKF